MDSDWLRAAEYLNVSDFMVRKACKLAREKEKRIVTLP